MNIIHFLLHLSSQFFLRQNDFFEKNKFYQVFWSRMERFIFWNWLWFVFFSNSKTYFYISYSHRKVSFITHTQFWALFFYNKICIDWVNFYRTKWFLWRKQIFYQVISNGIKHSLFWNWIRLVIYLNLKTYFYFSNTNIKFSVFLILLNRFLIFNMLTGF